MLKKIEINSAVTERGFLTKRPKWGFWTISPTYSISSSFDLISEAELLSWSRRRTLRPLGKSFHSCKSSTVQTIARLACFLDHWSLAKTQTFSTHPQLIWKFPHIYFKKNNNKQQIKISQMCKSETFEEKEINVYRCLAANLIRQLKRLLEKTIIHGTHSTPLIKMDPTVIISILNFG